jgi:hypothetical protein
MADKSADTHYVATRDFTDASGREYKLNQDYYGNEAATAQALEAGNIAEYVPPPPPPEEQEAAAKK